MLLIAGSIRPRRMGVKVNFGTKLKMQNHGSQLPKRTVEGLV